MEHDSAHSGSPEAAAPQGLPPFEDASEAMANAIGQHQSQDLGIAVADHSVAAGTDILKAAIRVTHVELAHSRRSRLIVTTVPCPGSETMLN
mgnify:CR=1 FL=1